MELTRVLNGEHPPPSCLGDFEVWSRYCQSTRRWIAALSATDCEALIDDMEAGRLSYGFVDQMYAQYGKLLGLQAIIRKGVVPDLNQGDDFQDRREILSDKRYKTCNMISGWGRRDPESAWQFFRSWDRPDNRNPLRDGHLGSFNLMLSELFRCWAAKDADAAFSEVLGCHQEEFEWSSGGYFRGLKGPDFFSEAAKLDRLLTRKRELGELTWSSNDQTAEYALGLTLASLWVDRDPAAAFRWWKSRDDPERSAPGGAGRQGYWQGLLFERWSDPGTWDDPSPPIRAAQWLEDNPQSLLDKSFRDQAMPAVARKSPGTAIRLIKGLGDPEQQAYYLRQLVRAPAFSGSDLYRRMEPSVLLDPDIVEAEMSHFEFTPEQADQLRTAIAERRKYEAEKPVPTDSGW